MPNLFIKLLKYFSLNKCLFLSLFVLCSLSWKFYSDHSGTQISTVFLLFKKNLPGVFSSSTQSMLVFCYTFWYSSWEREKVTLQEKVSSLNVKEIMWKLCLSLLLIFLSPNLIIQPHLSKRETKKYGPEPDGLCVTI